MATCDSSAWSYWTTTCDSGTASSSIIAWSNWTTTYQTCTSTADSIVWKKWAGASPNNTYVDEASTTYYWQEWTGEVEALKESREQRRAREAQAEIDRIESQRKIDEFNEAKKNAELTAQELLKDLISDDEMDVYLKTGRVLVKGKKHDYLLVKGWQVDVIKLEKGKVIDLKGYKGKVKGESYCVHPVDQGKLPETDKVIAMKIALEAEEESIMNRANARGNREFDLAVGM
jgi:hypothetical protein